MKPPVMFSKELDETTLAAGWQGIGARRAARKRTRRVLLLAPVVAAAALVVFLAFGRRPVAPSSVATPHVIALAGGSSLPETWATEASRSVAFDDGSHIELASGAVLHPRGTPSDPARVDLVLERGGATFDIRPGGPRAWSIEAGVARVRVLGTRFTVARSDHGVHVDVERGKVRVESDRIEGGGRDLVAGDAIDVSASLEPVRALERSDDAAPAVPVRAIESLPSEAVPAEPKRVAVATSSAKPPEAPPSTPTETDRMARADAARAAGKPKEALAILASVVDDAEPNAPLAAFTMGKIHSETLDDPLSGARWFERAIGLGLTAALDEDAHARVVECYARAGRTNDAARAADRYEAKFPTGRHLARVRRWKKE